jgi:hypothetical protein
LHVDIISIPWGINEEVVAISIALQKASKSGVTILASGPNIEAGRFDPFPASEDSVFSIGSSDGLGEPSQPSLIYLPYNSVFCFLGEAVLGANPRSAEASKEKQPLPGRVRRNGNSTAVCVATGLIAMLIDYMRRNLNMEIVNQDEMGNILRMASERSLQRNYFCVSPWYIFGPNTDTKASIEAAIKSRMLSLVINLIYFRPAFI